MFSFSYFSFQKDKRAKPGHLLTSDFLAPTPTPIKMSCHYLLSLSLSLSMSYTHFSL